MLLLWGVGRGWGGCCRAWKCLISGFWDLAEQGLKGAGARAAAQSPGQNLFHRERRAQDWFWASGSTVELATGKKAWCAIFPSVAFSTPTLQHSCHSQTWGFPKIGVPFLGFPLEGLYSILGYIGGYPSFRKPPHPLENPRPGKAARRRSTALHGLPR